MSISDKQIAAWVVERNQAHQLLDQYEVPAGTLSERISALAESFNEALQGHKNEIERLRRDNEHAYNAFRELTEGRP